MSKKSLSEARNYYNYYEGFAITTGPKYLAFVSLTKQSVAFVVIRLVKAP